MFMWKTGFKSYGLPHSFKKINTIPLPGSWEVRKIGLFYQSLESRELCFQNSWGEGGDLVAKYDSGGWLCDHKPPAAPRGGEEEAGSGPSASAAVISKLHMESMEGR